MPGPSALAADDHAGTPATTKTPALAYLALVGSNLAFILPATRAYEMGAGLRAFLYTAMVFSSGFYHLCKPADGICVLPYAVLFFLDFFFALTLLMSTLLFLAPLGELHLGGSPVIGTTTTATPTTRTTRHWHRRVRGWMRVPPSSPPPPPPPPPPESRQAPSALLPNWWRTGMLDTWLIALNMLLIGVMLGVVGPTTDPPFWFVASLAGLNQGIVLFCWLVLWCRYRVPPSLDWRDVGIAFVLAGSGIALFLFMEQLPSYPFFHSLWHLLAALGSFYLLETRCPSHSGLRQFGEGDAHNSPLPAPYQRDHLSSRDDPSSAPR